MRRPNFQGGVDRRPDSFETQAYGIGNQSKGSYSGQRLVVQICSNSHSTLNQTTTMRPSPLAVVTVLTGIASICAVAFDSRLALVAVGLHVSLVPLALWTARSSGAAAARADSSRDYEILDKLGEGGMGEVFRARHAGLRREVALKRIKPRSASAEDRLRFRREARVLSSLSNPHTINVFDAGIRDDGSFFYVMELLDGLNLDQLLTKEGPLQPSRVIHLLRQTLRSLAEAHERGLVHRDLKPANLMLCRYGGDFDFVKVLDFGLVKIGGGEQDSVPPLSAAGALPGSPAFLPPESILGSAFVDARADLYSLGAVAFFMLTGRFLFDADTPMAMIEAQLNDTPPSILGFAPTPVPVELDDLIQRCLSKAREDRPQSARQLLLELEELAVSYPWTAGQAEACWKNIPKLSRPPDPQLPGEQLPFDD